MLRLQTLERPISILQARHNSSEAKKKYSQEENGLHSCLYIVKGDDVMLTSNYGPLLVFTTALEGKLLILST